METVVKVPLTYDELTYLIIAIEMRLPEIENEKGKRYAILLQTRLIKSQEDLARAPI